MMSQEPITPSQVFKVLPTRRTVVKGVRDTSAATIGYCIAYTIAHMSGWGLSPEAMAALGPLATFGYRVYRGWTGVEPVDIPNV